MNNNRLWVLGAPDPEMEMIEALLRECGERVEYATAASGERIRPGQYGAPIHIGDATTVYTVECDLPLACGDPEDEPDMGQVIIDGSRFPSARCCGISVIRIDHHCPGDPGYGRPPEEFLPASSIGQVIAELAAMRTWREETPEGNVYFPWEIPIEPAGWRTLPGGSHHDHDSTWGIDEIGKYYKGYGEESGDAFVKEMVEEGGYYHVPSIGWVFVAGRGGHELGVSVDAIVIPDRFVLVAAADHCLGAAYRGECPGVDPDDLMRWRAESRARFQGRTVEEVLADIKRAQEALLAAPELALSGEDPCSAVVVRDMRQPVDQRPTRELPEAATRLGIGYVSGPLVGPDGRHKITCSGTAEQVRAFLEHWAPSQGLVDLYGDPARGFAGGYLP